MKATPSSNEAEESTSSLPVIKRSLADERKELVVVLAPIRLYEADEKALTCKVPKRPYDAEEVPWASVLMNVQRLPVMVWLILREAGPLA